MILDRRTHDELITLRHELHRLPETAGEERETSDRVARFLEQSRPDEMRRALGGHGLAAVYGGVAEGPTILVRCELDGLPIEERSTVSHRSRRSGRGHLCGHDGHMTIVAALAPLLHGARPERGRVVLLFQPAEETGAGAKAVIDDPAFKELMPDYAFALHNLPGLPLHQASLKPGLFSCASRGIWITLRGSTAHASRPEDGVSPARAMCELVQALAGIQSDPDLQREGAQVTVVHASLGEASFAIAPGNAKVMATLRSESDEVMLRICERSESILHDIARRHGLEVAFGYGDVFAATVNDEEATAMVRDALRDEGIAVRGMGAPMRWSEDFGRFGNVCRSAMFVLGAGESHPGLHCPDYDFPDELIETGARILNRLIRNALGP